VHLSSANIATQPIELRSGGRTVRSGIGKRPVTGAVEIGSTIGVLEFIDLFYEKEPTRSQLERALAAPICERGRREHERQLAALRCP
jgi:MOSC domain-containing protein YiiM